MYSHWRGASAAIDSYFVGNSAAQVVPMPPSSVNPPVNAINTMPMKRRNFAKKLFADIAFSFWNNAGHVSNVICLFIQT
jgi:hypothetical protein